MRNSLYIFFIQLTTRARKQSNNQFEFLTLLFPAFFDRKPSIRRIYDDALGFGRSCVCIPDFAKQRRCEIDSFPMFSKSHDKTLSYVINVSRIWWQGRNRHFAMELYKSRVVNVWYKIWSVTPLIGLWMCNEIQGFFNIVFNEFELSWKRVKVAKCNLHINRIWI